MIARRVRPKPAIPEPIWTDAELAERSNQPPPRHAVYCATCGRPAQIHHATGDPRYPAVWCQAYWHRPGVFGGMLDQQAAIAAANAYAKAKAMTRHRAHIAAGRLPDCPICHSLRETSRT